MAIPNEAESTLTDRFQTTVPLTVRRALKLGKRDKIHYTIQDNATVLISRAQPAEPADPVLEKFLEFLARDIASHPARLQSVDHSLIQRIQSLVGAVDVALDSQLTADDE